MYERDRAVKEAEWNKQADRFRNEVGDKLGRVLDEQTIDVVVGLNLLGFETTASCEGHMDHGTGAPYLDIRCPAAELYDEKELEFYKDEGLAIHEDYPISFTPEQYRKWDKIMEAKDKTVQKQIPVVQKLIDEFHKTHPNGNFVAKVMGGEIRIEPEDIEISEGVTYSPERLGRNQQELSDFAFFLKAKYLRLDLSDGQTAEQITI